MTTVFINIKELVSTRDDSSALYGQELRNLPTLTDAYLVIEDHQISEYGSMTDMPGHYAQSGQIIDVTGKMVLPCWCDSHTHLVFAGSRENEFVTAGARRQPAWSGRRRFARQGPVWLTSGFWATQTSTANWRGVRSALAASLVKSTSAHCPARCRRCSADASSGPERWSCFIEFSNLSFTQR